MKLQSFGFYLELDKFVIFVESDVYNLSYFQDVLFLDAEN